MRVTAYMCLTDFVDELELYNDPFSVYSSLELIRERRPCVEECGIAKVTIEMQEIVQVPNYK